MEAIIPPHPGDCKLADLPRVPNRPTQQDAIELKAKVVMEVRCCVLLNDK
jgi:hypothetical protein